MGVVPFFLFFLCGWLSVVTVCDVPRLWARIRAFAAWYSCDIGSLPRDLIIVYVMCIDRACLLCGIMLAKGRTSVRPVSSARGVAEPLVWL
jgi:hypothetical protein